MNGQFQRAKKRRAKKKLTARYNKLTSHPQKYAQERILKAFSDKISVLFMKKLNLSRISSFITQLAFPSDPELEGDDLDREFEELMIGEIRESDDEIVH